MNAPAGCRGVRQTNRNGKEWCMPMKTMKLWAAALLIFAMTLHLAGCANREPTAKTLMAGIPAMDPQKYYDMTVEMDAATQVDGQTSELSMSFGAEGCGDIMHLYDLELSLGANGISLSFSMEGWMEFAEKTLYGRMTMLGRDSGWMRLSSDLTSGAFPVDGFREIVGSAGSLNTADAELNLAPHTQGEDYVVTWAENDIDMGTFSAAFSDVMGDLAPDGTAQPLPGSATAEAHFDEETHDLKFIRVEAETADSQNASTVRLTLTPHTINGELKLTIPQNIIDTAQDAGGLL